jgi:hypothetical protein
MANKADRQYLVEHRLSDVLALIQVLALDRHAHRDNMGDRFIFWTKIRT